MKDCFYHLDSSLSAGTIDDIGHITYLEDLHQFCGRDIYFSSLSATYNGDWPTSDLPRGHKNYIIFAEIPDFQWIQNQAKRLNKTIIVLAGFQNCYDADLSGIEYVPWIEWHYQIKAMIDTFGIEFTKNSTHIVSCLCARVAQNKIWALMQTIKKFAPARRLISLNDTVQTKNVHDWTLTGCQDLDQLTQEFRLQWLGQKIQFDDFKFDQQTCAKNHDFFSAAYVNCVFNVTNESWPYSYHSNDFNNFIWPGPFLTEKTLKCLLSETAVIANGQFDTYKTLEKLGFQFNYDLDLSWDSIPGNFDRMRGMLHTLEIVSKKSLDHWIYCTEKSRLYNRQHALSQEFQNICNAHNDKALQHIDDLTTRK